MTETNYVYGQNVDDAERERLRTSETPHACNGPACRVCATSDHDAALRPGEVPPPSPTDKERARHVFAMPAATPIFLNCAIIFGALGLSRWFPEPATGAAIGALIGGMLQWVVQLPRNHSHGIQGFSVPEE